MFDAICVSERSRKPWTVAGSFIGQAGVVALAILVPLVSTEGLPHARFMVGLPEPPRALPHHATPAAVKVASVVPSQRYRRVLVVPSSIPAKAAVIQDPVDVPSAGEGVGVPGGFGSPGESGNAVIDGFVRAMPVPEAPAPAAKQAAQPAPIQRIKVGGKVQEGKLLSGPRPVYPPLAKAARVEGTVRLEAVISRDGSILGLRVVSGHPLLVQAALSAVQQWVFRPTTLNGDPVEVATEIEVTFALQK